MQWIEAEDGRILNTRWVMVIQKSADDEKTYAIVNDAAGKTDFVVLKHPIEYLRMKLLHKATAAVS